MFARIRAGLVVCFAGGRRLGTVVAVRPGQFKLKTVDGDEIWVRNDAVFTVDSREIDLLCEPEGLHNYMGGDASEAC